MKLQFQAVSEADDEDIRAAVRENFSAYVKFVAETIEEGKRRGAVRADVDARLVAWQFLGIGLTLDMMHLLGFDDELDRAQAEQWARLYLGAIRAPRRKQSIGPGVRAVSELGSPVAWPVEAPQLEAR
jgi:hypothetical protein